jgi:hypothetical protein
VTLAQNVPAEQLKATLDAAVKAWEHLPNRSFYVDRLVWVQNTFENRWLDLASFELLATPVLG